MGTEFHLDTRIRRCFVPLITQQHRLHHLHSIALRNLSLPSKDFDMNSKKAVYFTLHAVNSKSSAFYKSEAIYDCLNPSWKSFEVANFPDHINKASSFIIIKVWCQVEDKRLCLTEWTVYFSGLTYIGEQIQKEGKNFKPNTLLFGMLEGYYGSIDCFQNQLNESEKYNCEISMAVDVSSIHKSYTVNTLSRIKTLERAIVQTQAAVQRIRAKIEQRLQSTGSLQAHQSEAELQRLKVSMLRSDLNIQHKKVESLQQQKEEQEREIKEKRSALMERFQQLKDDKERLADMQRLHIESRENLLKTNAKLLFRQKQLVSELTHIYPLVQFPDKKGFSICGVYLPNSEDFAEIGLENGFQENQKRCPFIKKQVSLEVEYASVMTIFSNLSRAIIGFFLNAYLLLQIITFGKMETGRDEKMLSVALGYVCHVLTMISRFLNVPLRYPVRHFGSQSTITDFFSDKIPVKERELPLYTKGKTQMHFNYGVYLLNKNIAQFRHYLNLSTQDLSATLPNLHSLIELKLSVPSESYVGIHPSLSHSSTSSASLGVLHHQMPHNSKQEKTPGHNTFLITDPNSNLTNDMLSDKENAHAEMMEELKKEIEEMIPKDTSEEINFPKPTRLTDITTNHLSCSLDKGLNDYKVFSQSLDVTNWNNNNIETGKLKTKVRTLGQGHYHSSVPNLAASISRSSLEEEALSSGDERQKPMHIPLSVWKAGSSQNSDEDQDKIQDLENVKEITEKWNTENSALDCVNFLPHCDDKNCDQCKEQLLDLVKSTISTDLTTRTHQLALRTGSFQLQRTRTSTSSSVEID